MHRKQAAVAVLLSFALCQGASAASDNPIPNDNVDSDWDAITKEADAEKAAYLAQEAVAKAQIAAIQAEIAASTARYSTPGQTEIKGGVTLGATVGKPEGLLLVNRSAMATASKILTLVEADICSRPNQDLLILTSGADLDTPDAILFDARLAIMDRALDGAQARYRIAAAHDPGGPIEQSAGAGRSLLLPKLGAITQGLSSLGSWFRSDYELQDIAATYPANAVADHLAGEAKRKFATRLIVVPRHVVPSSANTVLDPLFKLDEKAVRVATEQAAAKIRAAELRSAKHEDAAKLYDAADFAATEALKNYNALLASLMADPAAGVTPLLVRILRQKKILSMLSGNALVLSINGDAAAQLYSKKNLWTFFGGPPVYATGATVLSYALIDPASGGVLTAGQVSDHGGYHSVREVRRLFSGAK